MSKIYIILFSFFISILLSAQEPIDFDRTPLNVMSTVCPECKKEQDEFEKKLEKAHFQKQPKGHCYGVTLFLIKYLLEKPELFSASCAQILSTLQADPSFQVESHLLSMNQHIYYRTEQNKTPLDSDESELKRYFEVVVGKKPQTYLYTNDTIYLDQETIFSHLEELKDQLIMVGYTDPKGFNHCIAFSTHPTKYFIFDSNYGLYHFSDLESLSENTGNVLKRSHFRWLVTFPLDLPT